MSEKVQQKKFADRPPRIQPILPEGKVPIPQPPEDQQASFSMRQALFPLITIAAYLVISLTGQGRNLLFILPMALSVVASSLFGFMTYREEREKARRKREEYDLLLAELRREMVISHDTQRSFYNYNYPAPEVALAIDGSNADNRAGSRLWERRSTDEDFGMLRLGIGSRPSTVVYEVERGSNEEDSQMKDAIKLDEDSRTVFDVPITVPLYLSPIESAANSDDDDATVIRNAIGVSGESEDVYPFVRSLLAHYLAFHAPTDASLQIVGVHDAAPHWDWIYAPEDRSNMIVTEQDAERVRRPLIPHFVIPKSRRDALVSPVCFESAEGRHRNREEDRIAQFWKQLRAELDRRSLRLREEKNRAAISLPFLLVVVDMLEPFDEDNPDAWLEKSLLKDVEAEAAVATLLSEGAQVGAAVLFLVPSRRKIPSGCTAVIEVSKVGGDRPRVDFRYAEVGVNSPRFVGEADGVSDVLKLENFVANLANWNVRRSYGQGLPDAVDLLEMNGVRSIEQLFIDQRWRETAYATKVVEDDQGRKTGVTADWLLAAVGMMSNDEIRRLSFKADGDGVHGMIAGSTGSGKSELLMTLILSLALDYDPSIINFVLIDYKGGAAFEPFKNLPHCVDIVTNLQGAAVDRMFRAINAELNRRQEINTVTNSKHIVDYRQRGLHLMSPEDFEQKFGREKQPYPHLFIIIDEFAEMMESSSEFKEQLNSITRLGRALGVSLILAAQRPTGVTDQMRANIKFRICLRVETPGESSEMLRRPDAAFLPNNIPGRGYLQVGNENIELIQVAWSGAKYGQYRRPMSLQDIDWNAYANQDVIWPERLSNSSGEPPQLFEVLVDTMDLLAKEQSQDQYKPWPKPLPAYMALGGPVPESGVYLEQEQREYLEGIEGVLRRMRAAAAGANGRDGGGEAVHAGSVTLHPILSAWQAYDPESGGDPYSYLWQTPDWREEAMRTVVGLVDDASNAKQRLLYANLRQGHLAVFGAPGWGKTSFLRTLMISLAATHAPEDLYIYVLDFAGQSLLVMEDLPHVGSIIGPDDPEKIDRLLRKLDDMIDERKQLFNERRVTDLYSYNLSSRDATLPAVLVIIDNFAEIRENMDHLLGPLGALLREGRAAGIHFVATAEQPGAMGKLFGLFTERVTLKQSDPTEYGAIVGRGVRGIEEVPGRGLVAINRTPLEFQTAVAIPVTADDRLQDRDETSVLSDFIKKMARAKEISRRDQRPTAPPIENLRTFVTLTELLDEIEDHEIPPEPHAVLGLDDLTLQPLSVQFRTIPHFTITGQQQAGKTTALRNIILSLAHNYSPERLAMVLIDRQGVLFNYAGRKSLLDLPHVIAGVTEPDELEEVMDHIVYEYETLPPDRMKPRELFVIIDNYDDFAELKPNLITLSNLTRVKMGRPLLHFIACGSSIKMRTPDDLVRRISRFGLAMDNVSVQAQPFNINLKKNLREAELPLGRGFLVRSGRASIVQVASQSHTNQSLEDALDRLVLLVTRKYTNQATWVEMKQEEVEAKVEYTDEQIAVIRDLVAEKLGISGGALAGIPVEDLIREASGLGVLPEFPPSVVEIQPVDGSEQSAAEPVRAANDGNSPDGSE